MQYLSKKYDDIAKQSGAMDAWMDEKDALVAKLVAQTQTEKKVWIAGAFVASVSSLFFFASLLDAVDQKVFHYPTIGWIAVFTLVGGLSFAAISAWVTMGNNAKRREIAEQRLHADLNADPLYVRAKLIVQALHDYGVHCAKYRAWFDAVDEGLTKQDDELAARYHAFIDRAYVSLGAALHNFQKVTELTRRQDEYRKTRPELAGKPDGTALGDLLKQLNQPVEMPQEIALADPRASLEFEETLVRVSDEIDGNALTERIEQAAARAGVTKVGG